MTFKMPFTQKQKVCQSGAKPNHLMKKDNIVLFPVHGVQSCPPAASRCPQPNNRPFRRDPWLGFELGAPSPAQLN